MSGSELFYTDETGARADDAIHDAILSEGEDVSQIGWDFASRRLTPDQVLLLFGDGVAKFDPAQPRDERGRWVEQGAYAGLNPTEIVVKMRELHKKSISSPLSNGESEVVLGYTEYSSGELNTYLRKGVIEPGAKAVAERQIETLDAAINRTSLPDDMTLFRKYGRAGKSTTTGLLAMKEGDIFEDKGFISATVDPRSIPHQGNDMVEVRVPKGHKGLPANGYSADEGEHEIILPRGTKFRVTRAQSPGRRMAIEAIL